MVADGVCRWLGERSVQYKNIVAEDAVQRDANNNNKSNTDDQPLFRVYVTSRQWFGVEWSEWGEEKVDREFLLVRIAGHLLPPPLFPTHQTIFYCSPTRKTDHRSCIARPR